MSAVQESLPPENGHPVPAQDKEQPQPAVRETMNGSVDGPQNQSSSTKALTIDGSIDPAKTPFLAPTSSSKPTASQPLTAEQTTKYDSLLAAVQGWTEVPNDLSSNASKAPITDSERLWLTRDCLLRYLRASKWVLPTAVKRVMATLSWRREWGVEKHTAEYISEENETGKQVITGFDKQARPCLYLNPHKQNTKDEKKQLQHLVFMIERCIDIMPPGQETLALLVNYKHCTKGQNASFDQSKQTLYILQNHYPERLGKALVKDVHWTVKMFYKLITPFIDPVTKEKLSFEGNLRDFVPPEQLIDDYGGDLKFEYEHDKYWPAFIGMASAKRAEMVKRWEAGGKKIGESEAYLKGEEDAGVAKSDEQTPSDSEKDKPAT